MKIVVGTIEHRHGMNVYVGRDVDSVFKQFKEYVDGEWDDEYLGPIPDNIEEAVSRYFNMTACEYYNWDYAELD